jgi:transcriptional regulator with GAF, ATPase, and Fis domain
MSTCSSRSTCFNSACAAIPEALLESELFGHEKGAFTGADRRRIGRFEQANGGTLFLDEVGDMPAGTQAKLLRVLQDQCFERVGGADMIRTDVRLVAATNKNLELEVAAGRLRNDLLFRLNVFSIHLPPLRERRDDIPLLTDHFVRQLARTMGRAVHGLAPEVRQRLAENEWPGNVRQLQSVLKYAIIAPPEESLLSTLFRRVFFSRAQGRSVREPCPCCRMSPPGPLACSMQASRICIARYP